MKRIGPANAPEREEASPQEALPGLFRHGLTARRLAMVGAEPGVPEEISELDEAGWDELLARHESSGWLERLGPGSFTIRAEGAAMFARVLSAMPSPFVEGCERAFARAHAKLAAEWIGLAGAGSEPAPTSFRHDEDNFRQALRLARKHRLWAEALGLLDALDKGRLPSADARRWEALLAEIEPNLQGLGVSPDMIAFGEKVLWLRGEVAHLLKDTEAEQGIYLQLKEHFESKGRAPEKAVVLHKLGRVSAARRLPEAALEWYRASLYLRGREGDEAAQSDLLEEMALLARAQGDLKQAEVWFEQSLALAERLGDEARSKRLLLLCGAITLSRGKLEQAEKHLRRALELGERLGDEAAQAESMAQLGALSRQRGQPAGAEHWLRRGCRIYQRLGQEAKEAQLLAELGEITALAGAATEAEDLYRQTLALLVRLGDKCAQARVLTLLGTMALQQRRWREAEVRLQQALRAAEAADDSALVAGVHHHLGNVAYCSQRFIEAKHSFKRSLELSERLGLELQQADLCYNLGLVAEHQKEFREAGEWYGRSLRQGETLGHDLTQARAARQLAHLAFLQEHYQLAQQWCERLVQLLDRQGNLKEKAAVLYRLGRIATERRQHDEAADWFQQALALWEQLGDVHGQMRALEHLAALPSASNEKVAQWYEQKLGLARSLGDRKLEGRLLRGLGDLARKASNGDAAMHWYRAGLAIEETLGNRKHQAELLQLLGLMSEESGQLPEAEQFYRRSVDLYGYPSGRRSWHSPMMLRLAETAFERKDFEEASLCFQTALNAAATAEDRFQARHGLGRVALELGDWEQAASWLDACRKEDFAGEVTYPHACVLLDLGRIAHARRDLAKAERHYRKALQSFEDMGHEPARALTLHYLGKLAADQGKRASAVQLYEQAEALFRQLQDQERLESVRQDLERERREG